MPASGEAGSRVEILVVSEDGSPHATEVIRNIARRLLQSIAQHPAQRVKWPPIEAEHHPVVNAMQWKSRSSADMPAIHRLQARLARHLAQGPGCFVFFHIDADARWSKRPSSNVDSFDLRVRSGVRQLLRKPRRDGTVGEDAGRALERMVLLVPYFEMEAWTLQNTSAAIRIANERYGGRDADRFAAFAGARMTLDEDELIASTSLGKKHNLELTVAGYPTEEAVDAETSLAALHRSLLSCQALVSALRSLQ